MIDAFRTLRPQHVARLILAALLLLPAAPAGAQGGLQDGAQDGYVTLSKGDCDRLARHYPADDVAFQPGLDVRGRPVAPADLNGGPNGDGGLILPEAVIIPIEVEMFRRFGIPANRANFKGDIFIGEVVVDVASGRAVFNGQPLQSEEEAQLAALCQRVLRDRAATR